MITDEHDGFLKVADEVASQVLDSAKERGRLRLFPHVASDYAFVERSVIQLEAVEALQRIVGGMHDLVVARRLLELIGEAFTILSIAHRVTARLRLVTLAVFASVILIIMVSLHRVLKRLLYSVLQASFTIVLRCRSL